MRLFNIKTTNIFFIISAFLLSVFLFSCRDNIEDPSLDKDKELPKYEVSFDFNGEIIHVETVAEGKLCPFFDPGKRPGYKFIGWYKKDSTDLFRFELRPIYENITLHALTNKVPVSINVKFDANGIEVANLPEEMNVEYESRLGNINVEPLKSIDKDFIFKGWSYKKLGGALLQADAKFTKDVTLYASWGYPDITDVEGNIYKTMVIGRFVYMTQNLRTIKYNDGTPIQSLKESGLSGKEFRQNPIPVWMNFDNKPDNEARLESLGRYYSWAVVANDEGVDNNNWGFKSNKKNICPKGWHVPNFDEAQWLMMYLDPSDNGNNDWAESASILVNAGFLSSVVGKYSGQYDTWSFNGDDKHMLWLSSGWIGDWGSDGGWTPDGTAMKGYPNGRDLLLGGSGWPLDGRPCAYFHGVRCMKDLK